jgi:hypothetical protein
MEKLTIFSTVMCGWFRWTSLKRLQSRIAASGKNPNAFKPDFLDYLYMAEPTNRPFTARDERRTFRARQALWIRYEDTLGNVRESIVEVYHPGYREVIFTWCRRVLEPRAFARRSIQSWRLLNERYTFDQVTAQYWEEEGACNGSKRVPWTWWLREQLGKRAVSTQEIKRAA